jgi:hypothetical protein
VLHVRVHRDHRVAVGVVHPRGQGGLLPEIAREVDDADVLGAPLVELFEDRARAVGRAVADERIV